MGMPEAKAFLAALSLLSIPPVPTAPGTGAAQASSLESIRETIGIRLAEELRRGSQS